MSDGARIPHLLNVEFKARNNDDEYEAMIAGLRLTLSVATKKTIVQSDFYVAVNQFNDKCATIAENLVKFRDRVQQLLSKSEEVKVEHVPRSSNESAYVLSKIVCYAPIDVVTRRACET
ncbi:hypothetical protein LIER_21695 [Lithospermum erythrorhizon]|uniref:RNase H type-1 domain-containing protein n=1 Tax=Lithospermum erythrorhizon TaxID=34254 RepID=A0AAV3QS64_LITER